MIWFLLNHNQLLHRSWLKSFSSWLELSKFLISHQSFIKLHNLTVKPTKRLKNTKKQRSAGFPHRESLSGFVAADLWPENHPEWLQSAYKQSFTMCNKSNFDECIWKRLHRFWWRMLETKFVGDNLVISYHFVRFVTNNHRPFK